MALALRLVLLVSCGVRLAVAAPVCEDVGANCQACLQIKGCDFCELSAACFKHGSHPPSPNCSLPINLRTTAGGRSYTAVCARKCTSESCPVAHSTCSMVGGQPKCTCTAGYVAEGQTGHKSLCVRPHHDTGVKSDCKDAMPSYCSSVRGCRALPAPVASPGMCRAPGLCTFCY